MMKSLFIAEKPSVAAEFARALSVTGKSYDGYIEDEKYVITWCVGHLVTMCYPESYDSSLKKWTMDGIPFIPEKYRYQVIPSVKKQFDTVSSLLKREDVEKIYVCTDSGREGEYIYRLVDMLAEVGDKPKLRVWIDSQTEEEILRGIREALPLSAYDNLSEAAFLRAKEDYLMGINFSRVLSLKYGPVVASALKKDFVVISAGRVMTCVLGMVVRREREIRNFVKTSFYKVSARLEGKEGSFEAEWKAAEGSRYFESPLLYKDSGFKKREDAEELIRKVSCDSEGSALIKSVSSKKELKNPPLLYNLAELQNDCSRLFKIDPDETLKIAQELYEKKLTTYPRTDARVLSSAVAKEINKNLSGLTRIKATGDFAKEILEKNMYRGLSKSKYVNDKQITDHYAIIPTGQGLNSLSGLSPLSGKVYELICRRFLSIFYPGAEFARITVTADIGGECFQASSKLLKKEGYLKVAQPEKNAESTQEGGSLAGVKKGDRLPVSGLDIKEGETSPPKRYTSGSVILAMENAGKLIEDEELREQIKGSGIGTSATRAEILKKLFNIKYLKLNGKTQVISPTELGEMVNDVVAASIRSLLNPDLTASWEKGLTYVAEGSISPEEYMEKLTAFVSGKTNAVKNIHNEFRMRSYLAGIKEYYRGENVPADTRKRSREHGQKRT
ncbi:MAG: DNA topoisomerase [Candidatus Avilachnospira sp.]|jgi:DNA topoisomerase-3